MGLMGLMGWVGANNIRPALVPRSSCLRETEIAVEGGRMIIRPYGKATLKRQPLF